MEVSIEYMENKAYQYAKYCDNQQIVIVGCCCFFSSHNWPLLRTIWCEVEQNKNDHNLCEVKFYERKREKSEIIKKHMEIRRSKRKTWTNIIYLARDITFEMFIVHVNMQLVEWDFIG